ncbi:MAG: tail fiber domain-containing protein, partial [Bacteriovorax sp.]
DLMIDGAVHSGIYAPASGSMSLYTNGSERIRIDSTGNVGIGTSNPNIGQFGNYNKLAVDSTSISTVTLRGTGNANYYSILDLMSNEATSKDWFLTHSNSGLMPINSLAFGYNNGSTTSFPMVINSSGNVGIGTTSPAGPLHVNHSGANVAAFIVGDQTTIGSDTGIYLRSTGTAYLGTHSATGNVRIMADPFGGSSNGITVKTGGNVGIGTTTPTLGKLTISSGGSQLAVQDSVNSGNAAAAWVGFYDSTGTRTGYVGDGSAGNQDIYLNADIGAVHVTAGGGICTLSNGTGWSCSSDRRLKTGIQHLQSSLEKVMQLDGITYFWKNPKYNKHENIGLIAQDVEKVYPQLVGQSGNGFKSVEYSGLIAPIIEAIKELYAKWFEDSRELHRAIASVDTETNSKTAKLEAENSQLKTRVDKAEKENALIKQENAAIKARLERIERALKSK